MEPNTPSAKPGSLPTAAPEVGPVERFREGGNERAGLVGLDRNERLSPLPSFVIDEIRERTNSDLLTHYPSLEPLYEQLASTLGIPRQQLLLTPGSDAAVRALCHVYGAPGSRAVMLDPSYAMYPIYARMFGIEPVQMSFQSDLTVDFDRFLASVTADVRLIFIANPNQPTGTTFGDEQLDQLVRRAATVSALVVVDEAYYPFSGRTALPMIDTHRNLVITRTFSKAWGLAGVRIGFVAGDPEVIRNLYKVRTAYDVNAFAASCAAVVLSHPEVAASYAADVRAGGLLLSEQVRALGLEPLSSPTNFQVIRLPERHDPEEVVARLARLGYLVKGPFTSECLRDCIRITLGPPVIMERFARALAAALEDAS